MRSVQSVRWVVAAAVAEALIGLQTRATDHEGEAGERQSHRQETDKQQTAPSTPFAATRDFP